MPTSDKILEQMDSILDQLLQTAKTLKGLSRQVVATRELTNLQKSQEKLVEQLTALDAAFQKANKHKPKPSPLHTQIAKKLATFQSLNTGFIDNLKIAHGLLDFE